MAEVRNNTYWNIYILFHGATYNINKCHHFTIDNIIPSDVEKFMMQNILKLA